MKFLATFIFLFLLCPLRADAAVRFAICTTTCTWDNSSTAMWSVASGGPPGASAPSSSDTVTLDTATCVGGTTCTITVNADLDVQSVTMGTCTASTTGCVLDFSVNNNNITVGTFNASGSGLRTLKMGNGIWTTTAVGSSLVVWNITTSTNFTLVPNNSTIFLSGGDATTPFRNTQFSSLTYNNVTFGIGYWQINNGQPFANPVFNVLTISPNSSLAFANGNTFTVSSLVSTATSTDATYIDSDQPGSVFSIVDTSGSNNISWVQLRDGQFSGGATFVCSKCFNMGNNTGITFTGFSGGACILGGWLLWRDMPGNLDDNFPAWLEKAG